MRPAFVVFVVLVWISQPVPGLLIHIPLKMVVEKSDLIVVGTLGDIVEFSKWRTDYSRGIITVEEVLWGKVKASEKLVLEWRNRRGASVGRLKHEKWENTSAVWLLTFDESGYVRANGPWRARDVKDENEIVKILSAMPDKEIKEFVAAGSPVELLSSGRPLVSLTTFVAIITAVVGVVGFWVLQKIGPEKRRLTLRVLGVLLAIPIGFLVAYWHVRIYDWIVFSHKMLWRAAFVAIMLVVFYSTIGLACLMTYRKRR